MSRRSGEQPFIEIETGAIDRVRTVRIYEETIDHVRAAHPELRQMVYSVEMAIHDTLAKPTAVYQSNPPHRDSFKFSSSNHRYGNGHLTVAIKLVEGKSAVMKTAYFANTITDRKVWSADDE